MTEIDFNSVVQLATQGVFSVVFLMLYFQERKAHDETRKMLYETLREVSGLHRPLAVRTTQELGSHGL